MNKHSVLSNLIIRFLLALTVAGALFLVLGRSVAVHADPIPRMSDRQFRDALTDMTAEYDKDVTRRQAERNPYISERLIVKSTDRKLDPEDYGAVDGIQDRQGNYILQFESAQDAKRASHDLSLEDSTIYVEPDGYLYACGFSQTLDETLWGYSAGEIGADRFAEAISGISGNVEVAVLDTGISFTSPKLSMRLDTVHAKSFSTEDGRELNADQSKENSTAEKARHGTHVAGIVAQCTEGLSGVRILPVRVLNNSGRGYVSEVAEGIRYAAEQGAEVINLSLSGKLGDGSAKIKEAVDFAIGCGSVVVVVAGNDGAEISAYTPGNLEECLVVGSVKNNKNDYTHYSTSNYGSTVDVTAPGADIYSTSWENASDGYNTLTGTSMAAPHAAAAAAMLKLVYSDYGPEMIEQMLKQHVRDLGAAGKDDYYGYGMINLAQPADEVMALIDALPSPVSLDDRSQIASAREAYDALSEIQKSLVTNLSVLEEAGERIPKLEADHEAADPVMELISDLPSPITLADKAAVEYARAAYDALTDDQKSLVTNLSVLEAAEERILKLEADREAADAVIAKISGLPETITLDDKAVVKEARSAYDALTDDQKSLVTNLGVLEAAEEKILSLETINAVIAMISALPETVTLDDKADVEAARSAYNALTDDQKSQITNLSVLADAEDQISRLEADQAAAESVMELISDLPSPITLADKAAVEYARASYDALTDDQKSLVTNLSVLEAAEERIPELEEALSAAEPVIAQISALPAPVTLDDKAAVEEARSAYEALTDDQKSLVTNLSVLEAAEAKVQELINAAEDKEEEQTESQKKYARSDPKPNVTYRVPLKKKQKTKVLRVIGLADGDKVVSWKSSNKKKAKVTGKPDGTCQIKAGKKTGKVRITAVTASGRKVVFKLRIQSSKVKTKKIRIAKRTVRISVGETFALRPERYPITSVQKITYKSRDKSVAKVSKKGVIRGIAAGTTKVVISSGDRKIKVKVIVS